MNICNETARPIGEHWRGRFGSCHAERSRSSVWTRRIEHARSVSASLGGAQAWFDAVADLSQAYLYHPGSIYNMNEFVRDTVRRLRVSLAVERFKLFAACFVARCF